MGKELLAKEKYGRARPLFTHAFEVEPNSVTGREGLLLAADTYFLEGGDANYIQAEAKYRDFLNRFPTSEQAPYVQFQIANSLAQRMERPDRDQAVTRKALEAYQDLTRLFPTSEYATQGQEKVKAVRANLAEHEYVIGRFYMRYGAPVAASQRFEFLLKNYGEYPEKDKVMYNLGIAYQESRNSTEAAKTFEMLKKDYPDSDYARQAPTIVPDTKADTKSDTKPPEAKPDTKSEPEVEKPEPKAGV
jgi:outer membrane protein assembly factor BamD